MTIRSFCQRAVDLDVIYPFIFCLLDMTTQKLRDDKMFMWPPLIYQERSTARFTLALH